MRDVGMYWIKISRNGDWRVAHFYIEKNVGYFVIKEDCYPLTSYEESVIFEICENRIMMEMD